MCCIKLPYYQNLCRIISIIETFIHTLDEAGSPETVTRVHNTSGARGVHQPRSREGIIIENE